MFHRLVSGTILAHTESVMGPYIFDRQAHERSQPYCGFHVVREDEECSADGNDTTVQGHAVHYGGHGKLGDARMKEGA